MLLELAVGDAYGAGFEYVHPAIAMPAAALSCQIEQDLPQPLIDNLENGPYGKNYLRKLDRELMLFTKSWKQKSES